MFKIGIVGGNEIFGTAALLEKIFRAKGLRARTEDGKPRGHANNETEFGDELGPFLTEENGIVIRSIPIGDDGTERKIKNDFDLLIINSLGAGQTLNIGEHKQKDGARENQLILLNSDEKEIFKALQNNVGPARVITYGLNSKACVTVSSIADDTVQFCIQRTLPTSDGRSIEQQEFTIKADTHANDVNSILAAVTAAVINGGDTDFSLYSE